MNRELLEKPFDQNQIKQRNGNFGKVLDYIEGHAVIHRLNQAFEAEWSFCILKHEVLEATNEVVVLGELRAGDVVKSQFGSSQITRSRENGEPISLADDYKAAATDAVKKCATLLGVGLHLYNGDRPANTDKRSQTADNRPRQRGKSSSKVQRSANSNHNPGNGNGRLTSRQYRYILQLNDELGRSKEEIDQQAVQMFGSVVQFLSKSDASALIEHLLSK